MLIMFSLQRGIQLSTTLSMFYIVENESACHKRQVEILEMKVIKRY